MAITVSHGGSSIKQPGAYSELGVDNTAGSPLGTNNVLFLLGESTAGAPGATTGITEFEVSRLKSLIDTYGSGPLVDTAVAAAQSPSLTPGVGAVGKILVYKTNASTQASGILQKSAATQLTVKGKAWGAGDNAYSVVVAAGTAGSQKAITVTELGGTTEDLGENLDQDIISIEYTGDATTAVVDIAGASRAALVLTTTLAGDQTDGSVNIPSTTLANYTMKELVDYINSLTGYTAAVVTATQSAKKANELDIVTASDITSAVNLQRLQYEILDLLNTSTRIEAFDTAIWSGVPDNQTVALTGGAQGASTNTTFSTGYATSLAEDYNFVLPCISTDASVDIADVDLGFTDAASTYTISSVLTAQGAHLALRGNTKNRKEAQGFGGYRVATKATAFSLISGLSDYNQQIAIQDCLFVDAQGNTRVGQPHIFAAKAAGIRCGTDVGEPLTHKYLRTSKVGHVLNPTTLLETGDFNSGLDGDTAIDNGVLYAERKNNAYRIVVDNTTYGQDSSFIFNRGSVIEAAYFVNKTLRDVVEEVFVGNKTSNGLAESVKNVVRNKLRELNAPDVAIITSSDDAPEGFREDTFTVTVSGNTVTVSVEYKPVQGVDFALFNFTAGDISQSA